MINKFLLLTTSVLGAFWFMSPPRLANQTVAIAPVHVTTPFEPMNIRVFKDRVILPKNMLCPQWAQIAVDVGWRQADLQQLDAIIYRESRCYTAVHYTQDPNGGSYGLTQINGYWCRPSKWYPNGYLQAFGVLERCEELFYPRINLLSARLIWLYSDREHGNGWLPWRT